MSGLFLYLTPQPVSGNEPLEFLRPDDHPGGDGDAAEREQNGGKELHVE